MAKAHAAPAAEEVEAPHVDADGYRLVAGYRVRDYNMNGRPGTEIVVSETKRVVTQQLRMSEQFDLFEILSSSENTVYRNMASMAASVRALGNQPIGAPAKPTLFPKTATELKAILDELDDDGVAAILAVREASVEGTKAAPEDVAKNSVGTSA